MPGASGATVLPVISVQFPPVMRYSMPRSVRTSAPSRYPRRVSLVPVTAGALRRAGIFTVAVSLGGAALLPGKRRRRSVPVSSETSMGPVQGVQVLPPSVEQSISVVVLMVSAAVSSVTDGLSPRAGMLISAASLEN